MIADLGSDLFDEHREIALEEELAEDLVVEFSGSDVASVVGPRRPASVHP